GLDMSPILQLESDVMHLSALAAHEVHGVMVRAAAHEHEPILDPVGYSKAEHAGVERGILLRFRNHERKMPELDRPDAGHLLVLADRGLSAKLSADRPLGVFEHQHPGDAGCRIVARLTAHALGFDAAPNVVELGLRHD